MLQGEVSEPRLDRDFVIGQWRGSETPPYNRDVAAVFFRVFDRFRGLLQPVPDEPDPPRKPYGFKEREFKRDNALGGAAMPSAQDLAKLAGHHHDPSARKSGPKAGDPNDVFTVLQQNRREEQRHNLDAIEIKKIKSQKWRDYWIGLIGVNAFIVGTVLLVGPNIVSVMFGLAGVILFSCSYTWLMWQIISRY